MKRIQLPNPVRAREKKWIFQFVLEHVITDVSSPGVPVRELFKHYKTYVEAMGERSQLHIDGFGRMLPKSLTRKVTYFQEIRKMTARQNGKGQLETGTGLKAVLNVRIV